MHEKLTGHPRNLTKDSELNPSVWRGRLILLVKVVLAGGLLGWLVLSGRLQPDRLAAVPLDWQLIPLVLLVFGSMILPAVRWWWLLRIQGLHEPIAKVIRLTWFGYLSALVLPGAASGDLAKGVLILRHRPQARARAFSTVLADRVLGLHSLLCLGLISLIWMAMTGKFEMQLRTMALGTAVPLASMTIGLMALLAKRPRTLLFSLLPETWRYAWDESFVLYRSRITQLFGCYVLSLLSSVMTVGSFSAAASLLGQSITWQATFLAGPLIVIANCLPFTPGGIGLAEGVSSELFRQLGSSFGADMMALTRVCSVAAALPSLCTLKLPRHAKKCPSSDLVGQLPLHVVSSIRADSGGDEFNHLTKATTTQ